MSSTEGAILAIHPLTHKFTYVLKFLSSCLYYLLMSTFDSTIFPFQFWVKVHVYFLSGHQYHQL